jgi:hypothetical protein
MRTCNSVTPPHAVCGSNQVYGGSGAHLIIYHGTDNLDFVEEIIRGWSGVILRPLGKANLTIREYDELLTEKKFYDDIPTSHLLVFQTDVLMRRKVPAKFLQYDYVGAPYPLLPTAHVADGNTVVMHSGLKVVGNGGFSLRRAAAMSLVCENFSWREDADENLNDAMWRKPRWLKEYEQVLPHLPHTYYLDEDVYLSARVPVENLPYNHEAAEFSVEHFFHPNPCGMHKAYASGRAGDGFFSEDQLRTLLKAVASADSAEETTESEVAPFEVKFDAGKGWHIASAPLLDRYGHEC